MFLSKGYSMINPVRKMISDNILPHKLYSAVATVSPTTTEKPPELDKLYSKIEIELRGNEPAVLRSYSTFSVMAARYLGITVGRVTVPAKPVHERLTLLKCIHIYKKHRVQYEMRTYFRYMDFKRLTGSTADTFLEYLERNLPEGVAMKVTKVEIKQLPEAIQPQTT